MKQNSFRTIIVGLMVLTISACTNTESTLTPSSPIANTTSLDNTASANNVVVTQNTNVQNVQMLPIVGGNPQLNQTLLNSLQTQAAATNQITMTANPASVDLRIQGYLSSFSENGITNLIYVWDILDQSGNRIYRLQGQEQFAGGGTEPLLSVPPTTIDAVASKTIANFLAWQQT